MEFYDRHFGLGPKVYFGLRLNEIKQGNAISPFMACTWDLSKKAVAKGTDREIYLCSLPQLLLDGNFYVKMFFSAFVMNEIRKELREDVEHAISLMEYSSEDVTREDDKILCSDGNKMHQIEVAVSRCNIITPQLSFRELSNAVYQRCIEIQKRHFHKTFEYSGRIKTFSENSITQFSSLDAIYALISKEILCSISIQDWHNRIIGTHGTPLARARLAASLP